jgi:uncharacterized membrane protein
MRTLSILSLLFIASDAPDISGSLLQLGAVAFIALVLCYNQTKELQQ